MKKIKILAVFVIIVLLSITALSQLDSIVNTIKEVDEITPSIGLEQEKVCTTVFYDEIEYEYGECYEYYDGEHCLNSSGAGTDCSIQEFEIVKNCVVGENIVLKNSTSCKFDDEYLISIDKGSIVLKKQLDYSDFGPCVYEENEGCLIVTCQSKYDGANDGKFHGCKPGTSCQKFEICDDGIKTFFKNSRNDYSASDLSFFLPELSLGEVEE